MNGSPGVLLMAGVFEKALAAEGFQHEKADGKDKKRADERKKNGKACEDAEMNRGTKARKDTRSKPRHEDHGGNDKGLTDVSIGVMQRLQIMMTMQKFQLKTMQEINRGIHHKAKHDASNHGGRA